LVVCSVLLCLFYSASNAQETTSTYSLSDDGYVGIKIPFNFNFYGQTFTNSWMYDNGVISFLDPTSPYALKPWQWSSQPLSQVQSKYFIASLWSDISPVASTVYSSTTDGTFLRYNWNNISEFYSGGTRLNSFSTTIRNDGSISSSYYNLNINSSSVSVGTVGDPAKGEVNEVFWAPSGTQVTTGSILDWNQDPYEVVDPCTTSPMPSSCPGAFDSILKILSTTSEGSTSTTEPVSISTYQLLPPTPTQATLSVTATNEIESTATAPTGPVTSPAPTALNPQPKIGEIQVAGSLKPSMSQIMNILNSEKTRISQTEQMVADQVKDIMDMTTSVAETTAALSSNESLLQSNESSTRSLTPNAVVLNSLIGVPGGSLNTGVASSAQQAYGVPEVQQTPSEVFAVASFRPQQIAEPSSDILDRKLTQDITAINLTTETAVTTQVIEEKSGPVVNTRAKNNDAAGDVTIESMALQPVGFSQYFGIMPDVAFYAPKEVYRNQKVIDNQRMLRQMNTRSDRIHQDMVNEQYKN